MLIRPHDILIVDDEADIRALIKGILEDEGYKTRQAAGAAEAFRAIEKQAPGLVILDIWLQGSDQDGMQILKKIKDDHPLMPVLMISGHGTIETAVQAIKMGAYDFIEKPFKADRLLLMINRALEAASLRRENMELRRRIESAGVLNGSSSSFMAMRGVIDKVAQSRSRVLIKGKPGSGKDLVARAIHAASPRAQAPFIPVSCAALQAERLEALLFGPQAPLSAQAQGGTMFFDEVGDLPPESQALLVRFIQELDFGRSGAQEGEADIRIMASTNQDMESLVRAQKFREDLYYRLNVVPLDVPSLSERRQDIPELVEHFVRDFSAHSGLVARTFQRSALLALEAYSWPGNIRQLRNVVEWVLIMNGMQDPGYEIKPQDLPPEIVGAGAPARGSSGIDVGAILALPLRDAREVFEREYLAEQIRRFDGSVSRTAQFVNMERSALHRKLKSLNLLQGESSATAEEASPPQAARDDIRKARA